MSGDAHSPSPPLHRTASPFALHYTPVPTQTMAQQQASAVWTANYSAPQYGRKRATDLMVTGPTLRGGGGSGARPGSSGAYYARANDDATTYVSSTTYAHR